MIAIQDDSNALADTLKTHECIERWNEVTTKVMDQIITYIHLVCISPCVTRIFLLILFVTQLLPYQASRSEAESVRVEILRALGFDVPDTGRDGGPAPSSPSRDGPVPGTTARADVPVDKTIRPPLHVMTPPSAGNKDKLHEGTKDLERSGKKCHLMILKIRC